LLKPLDLCVDECNKLKPFHITQDTAGDESQAKGSAERPVLVHLRGRKIQGSHASSTNLAPEELDWHRKPRSTRTSSLPFATHVPATLISSRALGSYFAAADLLSLPRSRSSSCCER
jgi:hypothetical protein